MMNIMQNKSNEFGKKVLGVMACAKPHWVDWLNKKQLHTAIGYVSPFQFEDVYYDKIELLGLVA